MYLLSITKFKQGGAKATPQQTKPDNTKLIFSTLPQIQRAIRSARNLPEVFTVQHFSSIHNSSVFLSMLSRNLAFMETNSSAGLSLAQ